MTSGEQAAKDFMDWADKGPGAERVGNVVFVNFNANGTVGNSTANNIKIEAGKYGDVAYSEPSLAGRVKVVFADE